MATDNDRNFEDPESAPDHESYDSAGVVVGTFTTEFEAENARLALEAAGIVVAVENSHLITTLWHYSNALGGAKVRVPPQDAERALAILDQLRNHPADELSSAWFCGECQEKVEPGFERCWSCGKLREDVEQKSPPPKAKSIEDEDEAMTEWAERTAQRALKAAVIGLIFLPFLMHIYSIVLLIRLEPQAYRLSPADRRGCWQAWAINIVVIVAVCLFALVLTW